MKKPIANITCVFFDFFAAAAVYIMVYKPLSEVFTAILNKAEFIKYNTNFFIVFGCVAIPVLHILGLIETYLPRYFNRSVFTKVFYGTLIIFLLLGIGTAAMVKRAILHHGYTHCEGAAIHRKLLRIEAYVLDEDTCRQLTMEKETHRSASIR
jgi:hypothetical protein